MPATVADWQPRNPLRQAPDFYHRVERPMFSQRFDVEPEGIIAPGTIRRWWHALAGYVGAGPAFSWTRNDVDRNAGAVLGETTTPEQYMISTRYVLTYGNQRSNPMLRPAVPNRQLQPISPLVHAGNAPGRPSVRAEIPSFGSRIPSLNGPEGLTP